MKQASPVHFVAGFFEAIAPDVQRMWRQTERRGVLGMPHAAEVHRFDMHAPERPKSNRFAVRAHAVTIARRPLASLRPRFLALSFKLFQAQIPQTFLSNRRRFTDEQKRAMVQETEKPGVAVAEVCRRHGIATSLLFRWRVQFGLTARNAPQLATVALADGATNKVPALAALRDLVRPPNGMTAIELEDGRRVFAPAGSSPAEVKRQFAGKEKAS